MKTTFKGLVFIVLAVCTSFSSFAQEKKEKVHYKQQSEEPTMKTYVIEREVPGAGKLNDEQLKGMSQTSCSVLKEMGPKIEWVHSYFTENKVYCIYKAENEEQIKEHAKKAGFPVNSISELSTKISPATAN